MDFLTQITEIASAIGTMFVSLFQSVSAIFYTAPTTEGGTGELTFIGVLALMVLFIGLAIMLVNWIRSLIARR